MKKSKIKLLYGLPSFSIGGIENQLTQQFSYFNNDKYEIHLLTLFFYEGRPGFYEKLPSHVKTHIFNFRGYFDFKNHLALYKVIKEVKPDIVISSMFSANAVFRILKILFGYKIITREHNTYTDRTIFHRIGERLLSPLSDVIVAVSKDVAKFYCKQNWIKHSKVQVINNGIDLKQIENFKKTGFGQNIFRKEIGLSKDEKNIMNVARLKEQKNHKMLISVFDDFQKIQSNYKLSILGDGQERNNLTKQINKLDLVEKVTLFGFRNDVYQFYSISDFFVLSSRIEGFPNVFLEAMAFGLPVITTSVPGANEIIKEGKNGFIVSDSQDMLKKMLSLSNLSGDNMEAMRRECLATAVNFNIINTVKKYEDLFDKILK